jgi:hypothetical protein
MKKSFVSKLFGMQSERPLPPEPVVQEEEKSPEPESEAVDENVEAEE